MNVTRGSRIGLVTAFPDRFVADTILPELHRRGLVVAYRETPKRVEANGLRRANLDVVLFMVEMASHSISNRISGACEKAGIPLQALSRKKASWTNLPDPIESSEIEMEEPVSQVESSTKELERMYEEEHEQLRARIRDLEKEVIAKESARALLAGQVDELSRKLKMATAREGKARRRDHARDRHSPRDQVLEAGKVLIAQKLMTAEEFAAKVVTFITR